MHLWELRVKPGEMGSPLIMASTEIGEAEPKESGREIRMGEVR